MRIIGEVLLRTDSPRHIETMAGRLSAKEDPGGLGRGWNSTSPQQDSDHVRRSYALTNTDSM